MHWVRLLQCDMPSLTPLYVQADQQLALLQHGALLYLVKHWRLKKITSMHLDCACCICVTGQPPAGAAAAWQPHVPHQLQDLCLF
jgi:hypothetical protein